MIIWGIKYKNINPVYLEGQWKYILYLDLFLQGYSSFVTIEWDKYLEVILIERFNDLNKTVSKVLEINKKKLLTKQPLTINAVIAN